MLGQYSNAIITEDGRTMEYSEQDICEESRKIVRSYEKHQQGENCNKFKLLLIRIYSKKAIITYQMLKTEVI